MRDGQTVFPLKIPGEQSHFVANILALLRGQCVVLLLENIRSLDDVPVRVEGSELVVEGVRGDFELAESGQVQQFV